MGRHAASAWAQRPAARRRVAAMGLACGLCLAGIGAIGYGIAAQQVPPRPPSSPAETTQRGVAVAKPPVAAGANAGPARFTAQVRPLPASQPTRIRIPAIDVASPVNRVGLDPDGTIHVPQPGPRYDEAAWYTGSSTPGERGASVIIGHIDSVTDGPSVFFRLGALRAGDRVTVTRNDGTTAVFTVDRVEAYPKDHFPTLAVYGNTPRAELRLITCGGSFNEATGHYRRNIVVYAHLTDAKPARAG